MRALCDAMICRRTHGQLPPPRASSVARHARVLCCRAHGAVADLLRAAPARADPAAATDDHGVRLSAAMAGRGAQPHGVRVLGWRGERVRCARGAERARRGTRAPAARARRARRGRITARHLRRRAGRDRCRLGGHPGGRGGGGGARTRAARCRRGRPAAAALAPAHRLRLAARHRARARRGRRALGPRNRDCGGAEPAVEPRRRRRRRRRRRITRRRRTPCARSRRSA